MDKNKKKIPKLRFPGFTDEWEQRKLGEHTNLITKGTTPKDKSNQGNVTFVKVENLLDGKIISNSRITIDEHENYLKRSKLNENDILFSIAGTLGRTAVVEKSILPANTNQAVAIIRGYNFDMNFLLTSLNGRVVANYIRKNPTIGAQPNLSLEQVGNLIIWTPQIEEQKKIGEFFKSLEYTTVLHQRKLEDTKKLKQALLQKMFPKEGEKVPELRFPGFLGDWEQLSLSKVVAGNISDGDWIEKEHIYDEGEYRIIQTGNLGSNGEYVDKPNNAKFFYQKDFDELKANEIFPGDVLISRLAAPAGRTIILPETGYRMVTAVDVAVIRPNDNFDSYYLKTLMNSEKLINLVSKKVTGTTHKRISRKNLERVLLDVPICFEEQQKIGSFFKYLDNLISLHQQKLDHLNQQKKALLQQMFI